MHSSETGSTTLLKLFVPFHASLPVHLVEDYYWSQMTNFNIFFFFLYRIRKGVPSEARVVARVLPPLLLDFFPAQEIMNKVIGEFLSSQQPHPELMAQVLFKVLTCNVLGVPVQMTSLLGSVNFLNNRFVGSSPHVYYVRDEANERLQGRFCIELNPPLIITTSFASELPSRESALNSYLGNVVVD